MTDISSQSLALLLDGSFRSLLLAAAVALALRVWRVRDPSMLHLAWRGVLCGMLAMPALCLWVPAMPVGSPASFAAWQQSVDDTLEALPARLAALVPSPVAEAPLGTLEDEAARAAWRAPMTADNASRQGDGATRYAAWNWQNILISLYGLGVAWMAARLLAAWWLTRRLVADAEPLADKRWLDGAREQLGGRQRRVNLALHAGIRVPLATGWLRPTVLLPLSWLGWDEAKQRSVLTHELLHVRRGDYSVQLLAAANRVVFWFHPLAWALPRRLAALAEQCCDDGVVRSHGGRRQYARTLLEVAAEVAADPAGRSGRAAWIGNAMTDGEGLSRRIRGVLAVRRGRGRRARRVAATAIVALAATVSVAVATVQIEAVGPSAGTISELEAAPAPVVHETLPALLKPEEIFESPPTAVLPQAEIATLIPGAATDMAAPVAAAPVVPATPEGSLPKAPSVATAPRNFIMFFDDESRQVTRRSPRGLYTGSAAEAAGRWIEAELRPADRVAVLSYKGRLRLHQDLTSDRGALARALGEVTRRTVDSPGTAVVEPSLLRALPPARELKQRTRQVLPALRLVGEAAAAIDGDKVLMLFTAGLSNMSAYGGFSGTGLAVNKSFYPREIADLVDGMRASGVTVYTIFLTPPVFRGQDGGAGLLAARTDGGYFFRHRVHGVGPILSRIAALTEPGAAAPDPGVLRLSAVQ